MQPTERRIFFALILTAGLAWIALSADKSGTSSQRKIPAPQAGFSAPGFKLTTLDGKTVALSDFKGKAVLVNIWATWCPPCRAEMPAIEKIYNEYKDDGLIVLAVNATSQDNPNDIQPFVEKYDLTFPVLLDKSGEAAAAYQIRSLPSSFFIARDGRINEIVIGGPMSEALLRTRVEDILK